MTLNGWDVRFTQDLNDGKLDLMLDFLHIVEFSTPSLESEDHMRWKLKRNGDFDIRSFYNELRGPFSVVFPWKGVWKVEAPQQVSLFVWTVARDMILKGDNLRCRGFDLCYVLFLWGNCGSFVASL